MRTHSPDSPCFASTGAPSGGAGPPARARQIILSSVRNARAAPLAPVRLKARSVMRCKTAPTSSPISRTSRRTVFTEESGFCDNDRRRLGRFLVLALAPGELLSSSSVIGAGDQQVGKEPFFEYLAGTIRKPGKPDASAASVIAPYHLAAAMNETFGFWQVEAKGYGSVDFQTFTGLDGEAIFVEVE